MFKVNQSWLYGNVKPYFAHQGIKLNRDDMLFIEKCLGNIPPDHHKRVIRDYYALWSAKVAEHKDNSMQAINPRYEANIYLRQAAGDT